MSTFSRCSLPSLSPCTVRGVYCCALFASGIFGCVPFLRLWLYADMRGLISCRGLRFPPHHRLCKIRRTPQNSGSFTVLPRSDLAFVCLCNHLRTHTHTHTLSLSLLHWKCSASLSAILNKMPSPPLLQTIHEKLRATGLLIVSSLFVVKTILCASCMVGTVGNVIQCIQCCSH